MQNKTGNKHFLFTLSLLLFLHSTGCHGSARMGQGLEETFVGPCHSEGVGWKEQSITLVDRNDMFKDMIPVHWTRLVERPSCVDRIEIFIDENRKVLEVNPTDKNLLSFDITREVCKKQTVKIISAG